LTITSTSHTHLNATSFALTLVFQCPSIFNFQRSRLLQQSAKPPGFANC